MTAWVLVESRGKLEAEIVRLRVNSAKRRTSLKEGLAVLREIQDEGGISAHPIARAFGREKR